MTFVTSPENDTIEQRSSAVLRGIPAFSIPDADRELETLARFAGLGSSSSGEASSDDA
jgi:hypothetical protein